MVKLREPRPLFYFYVPDGGSASVQIPSLWSQWYTAEVANPMTPKVTTIARGEVNLSGPMIEASTERLGPELLYSGLLVAGNVVYKILRYGILVLSAQINDAGMNDASHRETVISSQTRESCGRLAKGVFCVGCDFASGSLFLRARKGPCHPRTSDFGNGRNGSSFLAGSSDCVCLVLRASAYWQVTLRGQFSPPAREQQICKHVEHG